MCDECTLGRTVSTCPTCRALTGQAGAFPFSRDSWSFSAIWDFCFEAFKREWVMLSVAVLVMVGVSMVMSAVSQAVTGGAAYGGSASLSIARFAMSALSQAIQGVLSMGLLAMVFDVLKGGRADFSRLGSQLSKTGKYLVQLLLLGVVFGVPIVLFFGGLAAAAIAASGVGFSAQSLSNVEGLLEHKQAIGILVIGVCLAFIPLIYFTLPLTFATMELVHDDDVGPWQAVANAFTIAKDNRLAMIGFGFVEGALVLAGLFACCVGMLPAAALAQMLMACLYLALRNGSGLSSPKGANP
jgi:hypothetical protein